MPLSTIFQLYRDGNSNICLIETFFVRHLICLCRNISEFHFKTFFRDKRGEGVVIITTKKNFYSL
jgi:hypothetical protein